MFQTIVLPKVLLTQVLRLIHDDLGHNGITRALHASPKTIL